MHRRIKRGAEIAFQGEKGAYSEEAVLNYFGEAVTPLPHRTLTDVFKSVESRRVSHGLVPVENSSEGSVNETYDLLLGSNLKVSGETSLRIVHCLIANTSTSLNNVEVIYSHPQALAQCRGFLNKVNIDATPTYDTAGSAQLIKEKKLKNAAAIASSRAADIYGMKVLATGIEDNRMNYTRFFILSHSDAKLTGTDKTSLIFSVKHRPGALYRALSDLATKKVNLTKIESRPTKQKPWEYNFYLDLEGHRKESRISDALTTLKKESIFVKVLGSYPKAQLEV